MESVEDSLRCGELRNSGAPVRWASAPQSAAHEPQAGTDSRMLDPHVEGGNDETLTAAKCHSSVASPIVVRREVTALLPTED